MHVAEPNDANAGGKDAQHILDISFNYVSAGSNNRIYRNWSYTENKLFYSVVSQY